MSASERLPDRVLAKAARAGRIRGIALDTWSRAKAQPRRAGRVLREGVSQARALHSRERRLVQNALYDLVRGERRLAKALDTDEPLALWLGWLVEQGLAPEVARSELEAPFEHLLDGTLDAMLAAMPPDRALAIRHGLPDDLATRLVEQRGAEIASQLLAASDQRAPITVRTNRRKTTREALAQRLADEGFQTTPCELAADGLHVLDRGPLTTQRSFRDGWFEVQDEGSQLLAELVPSSAEVLDLCAGAGGKSLALAARGAKVTAADVRPEALKELQRRARRAGVRIESVLVRDAKLPSRLRRHGWEAVLIDAPCSGTGVLRRHPEHRWQYSPIGLKERTALQRRILDRAAPIVAIGGTLTYGTCSVLAEENEHVVASFLSGHPDFEATGEQIELGPHLHGTDGFFGVVLRRRG